MATEIGYAVPKGSFDFWSLKLSAQHEASRAGIEKYLIKID